MFKLSRQGKAASDSSHSVLIHYGLELYVLEIRVRLELIYSVVEKSW